MDKSIDVSNFEVLDGSVFVIWKWKWYEDHLESESDGEGEGNSCNQQAPEGNPAADEEAGSSEEEQDIVGAMVAIGWTSTVTHTVPFKCMGSAKELRYQEALARAAQLLHAGEDVPCNLVPEPTNPVDSRAIAFHCKVDGSWKCIGYVLREVLEDVHTAINDKVIIRVQFEWVKFMVHWKQPGWYAAVSITRFGEWSRTVTSSQSQK